MGTNLQPITDKGNGAVEGQPEIIIRETDGSGVNIQFTDIYETRAAYQKIISGKGGVDVSILVFGYNNLTHTKYCVESILKYTTDIDYELVLLDNGSSDGTLEYYKSVPYTTKKIIRVTQNKGGNFGVYIGSKYLMGRYVVMIPNDVYVTRNWLSNMIKCAESDERIGFVATASDNISNFQSVNLNFGTLEEMQLKAEKYNMSDPRKWEERLRLMPALSLLKKECLDIVGGLDYAFQHDFSDDDISIRVRRAGYKLVFCGDVFVHHVGPTVTGSSSEKKIELLKTGRETFRQKYFGIDAWDDVNNFEPLMLSLVNAEEKQGRSNLQVLGIDVMCGAPLLQVKNKLRLAGIFDTALSAFGQEAKHWLDLKTICKGHVVVDRIEYLTEHFEKNGFDYILLGKPINSYKDPDRVLSDLLSLLGTDGQLLLKLRNHSDVRAFLNTLGRDVGNDNEVVSYLDVNRLSKLLTKDGYTISDARHNLHEMDETTRGVILKALKTSNIAQDVGTVFSGLLVQEYVLKITATRANHKRASSQDFQGSHKIGRPNQEQAVMGEECAAENVCSNTERSNRSKQSGSGDAGQDSSLNDLKKTNIATNLHKEAVKLQEIGRTELALKQFELILDMDGSNAEAYNDIGVLYFQQGNIEKALHHLEEAVRFDPGNVDYIKNIASIYLQTGRMDEAIERYGDILKKDPDNVEVLVTVAQLCSQAGLEEDARFYLARVLDIDPDNECARQTLPPVKDESLSEPMVEPSFLSGNGDNTP